MAGDKPMPFLMSFKAKTSMYGGLEKCKVISAIRGDQMTPGLEFGAARTESRITSRAARLLLLASESSQGYAVQSWNVPGAYMRAPNDPLFRLTMIRTPRADGMQKAPGMICLMRRAMQSDPAANAQWDCWRDYWPENWG